MILFGKHGSTQFNKLMCTIDKWVEKTLNYPYNDYNIINMVKEFLRSVSIEYMMGPLDTTKFDIGS